MKKTYFCGAKLYSLSPYYFIYIHIGFVVMLSSASLHTHVHVAKPSQNWHLEIAVSMLAWFVPDLVNGLRH